jgi:hypothetical protein
MILRRASCLLAGAISGLLWCGAPHAFDSELWPGEGIPRFAARSDRLVLHEAPDAASPVVTTQAVDPGQEITYDRTRVRTIDEGMVIARRPGSLYGRDLGDVEHLSEERYYAPGADFEEIPYGTRDSFAYLQYRAEGTCLVRDDNTVLQIDGCPWEGAGSSDFDLVRRPVTEWWVEVTSEGDALGWLQLDAQSVEPLPRKF